MHATQWLYGSHVHNKQQIGMMWLQVKAVATSGDLRLVVSASKGGLILLHHLLSGDLLQQFTCSHGAKSGFRCPSTRHHGARGTPLLALSSYQPSVIAYIPSEQRLYTWHVQGHLLATAQAQEAVEAMAVSACGRMLVVGGQRGEAAARDAGHGGTHRRAPVPTLLWLATLKVRFATSANLLCSSGSVARVLRALHTSCSLALPEGPWLCSAALDCQCVANSTAIKCCSACHKYVFDDVALLAESDAVPQPAVARRGRGYKHPGKSRRLHHRRHVDWGRGAAVARHAAEHYTAAEPSRVCAR